MFKADQTPQKRIDALTICQPYAELIARGEKPIENRTWPTPYRGWLAIHAGKSHEWLDEGTLEAYPHMLFGAFVAVARMIDCLRVGELPPALRDNEHANGPWCFVFSEVRPLPQPIPAPGAQGLWRPKPEHLTLLREATR